MGQAECVSTVPLVGWPWICHKWILDLKGRKRAEWTEWCVHKKTFLSLLGKQHNWRLKDSGISTVAFKFMELHTVPEC